MKASTRLENTEVEIAEATTEEIRSVGCFFLALMAVPVTLLIVALVFVLN